jgi:two-component system sensor histidine kinase VicK
MTKSIYSKLVIIILLLIVSLTTVVGAFLMRGVRNFYIHAFYERMQEVFAEADLAADLRAAADTEDAAAHMGESLRANMGRLGIDAGTRNYFILDGGSGKVLTGSDPAQGAQLQITPNILTAMNGSEGYAARGKDSYMDVALPISGDRATSSSTSSTTGRALTSLNAELFEIVLEAMLVGLVISVLLSLLLAKTMVTPIQHLTRAAEKVAAGDFSETVDNQARDEIGVLTPTFNDMAGQLEHTHRGAEERGADAPRVRRQRLPRTAHADHRASAATRRP